MELDQALAVIRAFNECGVSYILIGGVAMNFHGLIRGTEDVDFLVTPTAENAEAIRKALMGLFNDASIEEITAPELVRNAVIRYGPPDGTFYIDLLSRIGEAFSFEGVDRQVVSVSDLPVTIATPRSLYEMKRGTLRDKDRHDAFMLRTRFSFEER